MSKFKESIDKIEMSEEDKNKILKDIFYEAEEKQERKFVKFVTRFATFILAFALVTGSGYALVKLFKVDEKFQSWFDSTEEELEEAGVGVSDVSRTKTFDDAIVVVNQTILDEKELYIAVEITGKENEIYLQNAYLSNGTTFDETILKTEEYNDGSSDIVLTCANGNIYGCDSYGFGLLEDEGLTKGYTLTLSIHGEIKDTQDVTLRLVTDNGKNYDISFTLGKNDMKVKEVKAEKEIYNKDGLKVDVTAIRITPLHVIVDLKYNKDILTLTDEEMEAVGNSVYNDNSEDMTYVTFTDGTTNIVRLWYSGGSDTMLTPYGPYGTKEEQVYDVESVKSITINNVTFEIK